ncbi:choice-of-anchor Q domain-containing protein [Methylolobus aquaticus]
MTPSRHKRFHLRPLTSAILLALSGAADAQSGLAVDGIQCTLPDAITAANTDTATGGCPAGQGADTLQLTAATYRLAAAPPPITSTITLFGDPDHDRQNAMIEPEPGSHSLPFSLLVVGPGGDLTVRRVTLQNARVHGLVVDYEALNPDQRPPFSGADSRLQLVQSKVSGSVGSGVLIANYARADIKHSTISGNNRGISCDGYAAQCTIDHSVIAGNTSFGIYNRGSVNLNASSVVRNAVGLRGEAFRGDRTIITNSTIENNVGSGLELTREPRASLSNSTVSGNGGMGVDASGVFDYGGETLAFENSTITGNRAGGVRVGKPGQGVYGLSLRNTVIAGNPGGDTDCRNAYVTFLSGALIGDGSCDAAASGAIVGDPKLGPLLDNGGSTRTQALSDDSPAVHAGDGAACAGTDQRNALRPRNPACDSGAFERISAVAPAIKPTLEFLDAEVKAGRLVGALSPGKPYRVQAVRNQLLLTGDFTSRHEMTAACAQIKRTLNRVDHDGSEPDHNDYVTGPGSPGLVERLAAVRLNLGCK